MFIRGINDIHDQKGMKQVPLPCLGRHVRTIFQVEKHRKKTFILNFFFNLGRSKPILFTCSLLKDEFFKDA